MGTEILILCNFLYIMKYSFLLDCFSTIYQCKNHSQLSELLLK